MGIFSPFTINGQSDVDVYETTEVINGWPYRTKYVVVFRSTGKTKDFYDVNDVIEYLKGIENRVKLPDKYEEILVRKWG